VRTRILHEGPPVALAVVLETGDEVLSALNRLAAERGVRAAHFSGVGAFREARLAYFDWERREYLALPAEGQVEVVSLVGNVTRYEGNPRVHAHAVLGRGDGAARAGHLLEAQVRPTLELLFLEWPSALHRAMDADARIPLIDPAL
jgi:predicted DNA-binding protein with PD1-like motif